MINTSAHSEAGKKFLAQGFSFLLELIPVNRQQQLDI